MNEAQAGDFSTLFRYWFATVAVAVLFFGLLLFSLSLSLSALFVTNPDGTSVHTYKLQTEREGEQNKMERLKEIER